MEVKTKFNVRDRVYYIGLVDNSPIIVEDTVTIVTVKAHHVDKPPRINYTVTLRDTPVEEEDLFASIGDLVAYYTAKENVYCTDPQALKY